MEESVVRLESRVARLEANVDHMSSDISAIKAEQRDLRKSMDSKFDKLNATMDPNLVRLTQHFREMKVCLLFIFACEILSMLADAFHRN